jgi:hypothetical protein
VGLHTALFLEPGATNRLTLSLRSQISEEMDFALTRLIHYTSHDPDLVPLQGFAGLVDALLDVVDSSLADFTAARDCKQSFFSMPRQDRRRRAAEAALILRNLALESTGRNFQWLRDHARVQDTIFDALELVAADIDTRQCEDLIEIARYLFELLEMTSNSTAFILLPPTVPKRHRAYPLAPLVRLTRAPDRAFVLSAFRVLANAATNPRNESAFSGPENQAPFDRAIELLPIRDAEVALAVLDFIYAYTFVVGNDILVCSRPDVVHIMGLLVGRLFQGAVSEDWIAVKPRNKPEDGQGTPTPAPTPAPKLTGEETKLSEAELQSLVGVPEPRRTLLW